MQSEQAAAELGETKALWLIANDLMSENALKGAYYLIQTGVLLAFDHNLPEVIASKLQDLMATISKEMSKNAE